MPKALFLQEFERVEEPAQKPTREELLALASDVPALWNNPATEMRSKQKIAQILLSEIVVDVDEEKNEVVLQLHWAGGRHSDLRVSKNKRGESSRRTGEDAISVVKQMAGTWPDKQIAATLNRLGLKTGAGNSFNRTRVKSLRSYHKLPAYNPQEKRNTLTLEQAGERLSIHPKSVRKLIEDGILSARQVVTCAPWEIPVEALEREEVKQAVEDLKNRSYRPRTRDGKNKNLSFPNM